MAHSTVQVFDQRSCHFNGKHPHFVNCTHGCVFFLQFKGCIIQLVQNNTLTPFALDNLSRTHTVYIIYTTFICNSLKSFTTKRQKNKTIWIVCLKNCGTSTFPGFKMWLNWICNWISLCQNLLARHSGEALTLWLHFALQTLTRCIQLSLSLSYIHTYTNNPTSTQACTHTHTNQCNQICIAAHMVCSFVKFLSDITLISFPHLKLG